MSDYFQSTLTVTGTPEELAAVRDRLAEPGKDYPTYERIVPVPEGVSRGDDGDVDYDWAEEHWGGRPWMTDGRFLDEDVPGRLRIGLDSERTPAFPLALAASALFPDLDFHWFSESDGGNWQEAVLRGGAALRERGGDVEDFGEEYQIFDEWPEWAEGSDREELSPEEMPDLLVLRDGWTVGEWPAGTPALRTRDDHTFGRLPVTSEEAAARRELKAAGLRGKAVAVTGKMTRTREAIRERIEEAGGLFRDSVTPKTDLLLVGIGGGAKRDKAAKLGVPNITEVEIEAMIEYQDQAEASARQADIQPVEDLLARVEREAAERAAYLAEHGGEGPGKTQDEQERDDERAAYEEAERADRDKLADWVAKVHAEPGRAEQLAEWERRDAARHAAGGLPAITDDDACEGWPDAEDEEAAALRVLYASGLLDRPDEEG